jgi:hypothetical protein
MSLTMGNEVFAAAHENGINDLIGAFFKSRRRYFVYGTPAFVPATTAMATQIAALTFPGIGAGIDFAVIFTQPTVDLHPDSSGGTSPLPPQANQFTLHTKVILAVLCGQRDRQDDVTHTATSTKLTFLDVFARGRIIRIGNAINLQVDDIEIVDIQPDSLETVLECVIRMMLNAVLTQLDIPLDTLSVGAFSLTLTSGPLIETDQVKVWGTI